MFPSCRLDRNQSVGQEAQYLLHVSVCLVGHASFHHLPLFTKRITSLKDCLTWFACRCHSWEIVVFFRLFSVQCDLGCIRRTMVCRMRRWQHEEVNVVYSANVISLLETPQWFPTVLEIKSKCFVLAHQGISRWATVYLTSLLASSSLLSNILFLRFTQLAPTFKPLLWLFSCPGCSPPCHHVTSFLYTQVSVYFLRETFPN